MLGRQLLAEGGPDRQAVHCDFVLPHTHCQRPLLGFLCCHKAAVHILVEPGVVAGSQVCHYGGKLDGPLDASPVEHRH